MGVAVAGYGLGFGAAEVAGAAAAVLGRVAVECFAPEAAARYADAVVVPRHWGEVEHHQRFVSQEREDTLFPVAPAHPAETVLAEVGGVQRWALPVEGVEVGDPALHTA